MCSFLKGGKVPWLEGPDIEFKASFSNKGRETYTKTLCALLNQDKGGRLLFGINNHGIVTGFVPNAQRHNSLDHLKLMMDDIVSHDLIFADGTPLPLHGTLTIEVIPVTISEFVVVVVCNSSKKVIRTNGEEYIRGNASTRLVRKGPIWYTEMVKTRIQEEDSHYDQLLQEIQMRHVIEMQQCKDLLETAKVGHITEMQQSNEIVYSYYRKERDMAWARTKERKDITPCLVPVLTFFVIGCVYVWLRP
jgi:predicted HTH transcriptional regulator